MAWGALGRAEGVGTAGEGTVALGALEMAEGVGRAAWARAVASVGLGREAALDWAAVGTVVAGWVAVG